MGRLCYILLLISGQLLAASPDSLWTRRYGGSSYDYAQGGAPDQSGGFVLVGQTQSFGPSGSNGYLVRTNALTGDTLFTKWYGGFLSDQFSDVHVSPSRMLAVGSTSSFGANPQNAWLVCTNAIGDTNWTRALDLGGSEAGLAVDYYADYFIAGWAWPTGGQPDVMVAKVNDSGTTLWTRTLGGSGIDWGYDVVALSDGGCVVVGETYNFGIGSPPFTNAWMIRYDAAGDTLWTKTFGDSATYDAANEIIQTSDGGFALAGRTEYYNTDQDVYLIKTDAAGNLEWSQSYGGGSDDQAIDLVETCDSGFLIGGATQSYGAGDNDFYLIRTDSLGDTLWTTTYGGSGSDFCYAVSAKCVPNVTNEGYFAAGFTESGSFGPSDGWLIRLDAEPWIDVTNPQACEEIIIGSALTITWNYEGFVAEPYVSVELNRNYPTGGWETLSASLFNFGFAQFTATGPASPRCRVRVSKLSGSPAIGLSETFQIRPVGNFQNPGVEWDSTYIGGAGLGHVITTIDENYASNYGSSIIKRDSIGGEIWTANYTYDNMMWREPNTLAITELSNGDLIAVGAIDTIELTANRSRLITLQSNASGTPAGPMTMTMIDDLATVGIDVVTDEAGDGVWVLATVSNPSSISYAGVIRGPGAGSGWAQRILDAPLDPRCCETADNNGLLIAGEIGDYFANTRDLYLVRIDSVGDTLWTRTYDFGQNEAISDIHRLASGGYVIAGHSFPGLGSTTDFLVVVLDNNANVLQQWNYDGNYTDHTGGVNEDLDGGILIAGVQQALSQPSTAHLMKFGCNGSLEWDLNWTHGNGQHFSDVDLAPDGGYIVSGTRIVPSGGGGSANRPVLTKYGSESWTPPPTCPTPDSLVIKFNANLNANILTWQGEETGSYFIFSKTDFDTTHGPGNGWTQIGCIEPSPPARTSFSFIDTNLTPLRKFYYVVHNCSGGCGGGEE